MTTVSYAFTIKCIKSGISSTEGELCGTMYAMALFHKGHVSEYYFEKDSLDRLHLHGIMQARKGILLSRFKKAFWHIHLDYLKTDQDIKNWQSYIKKDDISFIDFMANLRAGNNPFTEDIKIQSLDD